MQLVQLRQAINTNPEMPDNETAITLGVALKSLANEMRNLALDRKGMAHKVNDLIKSGKLHEADAKIAVMVIQALRGVKWT